MQSNRHYSMIRFAGNVACFEFWELEDSGLWESLSTASIIELGLWCLSGTVRMVWLVTVSDGTALLTSNKNMRPNPDKGAKVKKTCPFKFKFRYCCPGNTKSYSTQQISRACKQQPRSGAGWDSGVHNAVGP